MARWIWKLKRGKWRKIGRKFPRQYNKTLLLSGVIRAIYDKDNTMTPEEQQTAIKELPGMTGTEMQSIIMTTGPGLADSIRAVISAHRARNDRSAKDKAD